MYLRLNQLTLIVIFLASVFTSCSNDDDDNNQINIVGRWQVETKEHICPDESDNSEYPDDTIWEFKADGTYIVYNSSGSTILLESTYERSGPNIIYLCYAGSCSSSYSITFSDGKLIMEETDPFDSDCALRYTFVKA